MSTEIKAHVWRRTTNYITDLTSGALVLDPYQWGLAVLDKSIVTRTGSGSFLIFPDSTSIEDMIEAVQRVKPPVASYGLLPTPTIGDQCFVTGEDCYYQVGSDGTWQKKGIAEIDGLGNALAGKVSVAGDTMTGDLHIQNPTLSGQSQVSTKTAIDVDNYSETFLNSQENVSNLILSVTKDGSLSKIWFSAQDNQLELYAIFRDIQSTITIPNDGANVTMATREWAEIKLDKDNITKHGSGFDTPATTQVHYDATTRKVTLGGTGQGYWRHSAVTGLTSGWVSDARPDTSGAWFLKYNGSAYSWSNTIWSFDELQIAFGYKSATAEIWLRECHGLMDSYGHQDEHQARGTYKSAGGDFSSYTLGSNTATNRRPQISATTLWDEDLPTTLSALTTNSYAWMWLTSTGLVNITPANAEIISVTGTQPNYNQYTTSWVQTPFPVNSYGKIFVVAIPVTDDATNQAKRYLFIQPQVTSTTLTTIQAVTSDSINWGDLTGLLPEFNFIGEIIVRYTAGNWVLTSVSKINGNRVSQSVSGGGFLSSVSVDGTTITGDGTPTSPLAVGTIAQSAVTNLTADLASKLDTSATAQTKAGALTIEGTQASVYNTTEAVATPTGIQGNISSNISNTTGTASYHEVRAKNAGTQTARGYWGIVSGANAYTQSAMFWGFRTASSAFTEVMRLTTAGALSIIGALDVTGILTATAGAILKHSGTTRIETTTTGAKVTGNLQITQTEIYTIPTATSGSVSATDKGIIQINGSSTLTGGTTGQVIRVFSVGSADLTYSTGSGTTNISYLTLTTAVSLLCIDGANSYWRIV